MTLPKTRTALYPSEPLDRGSRWPAGRRRSTGGGGETDQPVRQKVVLIPVSCRGSLSAPRSSISGWTRRAHRGHHHGVSGDEGKPDKAFPAGRLSGRDGREKAR